VGYSEDKNDGTRRLDVRRVKEIQQPPSPSLRLPKWSRGDDGVSARCKGADVSSGYPEKERKSEERKDLPFRLSLALLELNSDIEPERVRFGEVVDHRPV